MSDYTKLIDAVIDYNASDERPRAALQAAIEALQAESASLKQIAELNAQIAIDLKAERDQLQSRLDAMGKGEPVASIYISAMGREFDDWKCELPEGRNLLYAAPKALAPEPDMFWNNDDPERQHGSIEEFLNDEICQGQPVEVGAVYTIQQAKRLPNVQIKVTSIDEESCEAEYEVLAAHGIGGTP